MKMKKPNWQLWIKDKKECELWLEKYKKKKILKQSPDESASYLRKADHNLSFANWIMLQHEQDIPQIFGKETFYDWAISMYYYAAYHAASALMSRDGYSSKSHAATLCHLIHNHHHRQQNLKKEDVQFIAQTLNKEDLEHLGQSKELREKASYDIHASFEKAIANHTRQNTVEFIMKIRQFISSR